MRETLLTKPRFNEHVHMTELQLALKQVVGRQEPQTMSAEQLKRALKLVVHSDFWSEDLVRLA